MSLATNITNLATRIATELKAHRVLINGNAADLSSLTTNAKSNLVAAINEVVASAASAAASGGASINDTSSSTSTTYSSTKISALVSQATSDLVNGAPGLLDTLNELATAIGNDPNFSATMLTGLANRVRFDAAQTLTAPQQTQAQSNMGVPSSASVGDTTTDFVSAFNAGLV